MKNRTVAIALSAVSVLLTLVASYQLKIKPFRSQFTKPLGTSIVFTCEAVELDPEAEKNLKLQWIGKDGREIVDFSGRIYLEADGSSLQKLYITEIQDGDNGTYTCSSSANGVTETKSVALQLFKDITFDFAPSPQHSKIYTDGLIMCRVSGNPRPGVSWRYRGRRILNDNRYTLEDGALRIKNITEGDNGVYSCRAEVDADGRYDERRITVVVHVPPFITSLQEKIERIESQEALIICKAKGSPEPVYEFYKDGLQMENSSGILINPEAGSLLFASVRKDDEGKYECQAINDVGRTSADVELRVLIKPVIHQFTNATVSEGETASIDCSFKGDPSPVILFFKGSDSTEIGAEHNKSGRIFITEAPGQVTLTIIDATPSDAAVYTCTATNRAGHAEHFAHLTVTYKPRFESYNATLAHGWDGKVRNISCRCLAQPAPLIEWLHNDQVIVANATYQLYGISSGLSYLEIKTNEENDEWVYGNYTCRARNQLGEAELNIEFKKATVPEPPEARIDKHSSNHLVIVAIPGSDGGVRVTGYSVEYDNSVQEFTRLATEDDAVPMPLVLNNLKSNTSYIFHIYARNEVGSSKPKVLHARTDEAVPDEMPILPVIASISSNVVIGIIVCVFVVFLLIIDVSCYFINGCGLTMCICVQLCGRTKPKMAPSEIEEGESKEILKETPPDLEADEAKSSQEDLEEEKQHLAETWDVLPAQVEALEEIIDQPQSLPENQPQPQERRGPPNRKSILSYGDGRWKDVVHELETQLGVKKTHSDNEGEDEENRETGDDFDLHSSPKEVRFPHQGQY